MRIRISRILLLLSTVLFVVALFCPAVDPDFGAWNQSDSKAYAGWACAWIYWPCYVSNLGIVLSPLICWCLRRWSSVRWPHRTLALFLFGSAIYGLSLLPEFRAIHVGYVLWISSFVLGSIGAWLAAPTLRLSDERRRSEAANQALQTTRLPPDEFERAT